MNCRNLTIPARNSAPVQLIVVPELTVAMANSWRADLSDEIIGRQALDEAERSAASSTHGRYLPTRDYLCDRSKCPVFENGAWQYTDTDHLSYRGAEALIDPIEKEIRRIEPRPFGGK